MSLRGGGGGGGGLGTRHTRGFLTEEEKANKPKITKALLKRIFSYLKPYRLQFFFVFVVILGASVLGLLPSIITGKIVDNALLGNNMRLLIVLLLAALGTLVASQVIGVLESYINAWISQRIIFDMKNEMYDHLQRMPHAFFTTEKQGDIITRMTSDIDGVSSVISGTLTNVVSHSATVITTIVALLSMSWQLALAGVLFIPFLILPTKQVGKTRYKLVSEGQEKRDRLNQHINETLSVSGSMLVKLFVREDKEYVRFREINDEVTANALKEQRSGRWFRALLSIITQLGPLLIYFIGGVLMIQKWDTALTVGMVTATIALVNRLYMPVQSLLNIQVDFTRSLALFTRIFDYLDKELSIVSKKDAHRADLGTGEIAFDDVSFSYAQNKPILKNISFTVPRGKMYAIVGPSGSGKSTIVNLIPRLYDADSGSVSIGGINVLDYDLSHLRESIGVVSQDTYLFNGTIKENLLYAKDDATDEELENACKIANIHDFIMHQPLQYETMVGNRGLKLSGGEKQRISIARVVLKDPKILILDEATSSLDSISETSIQNALEILMKGRTSIVIAHRLTTILAADKILVVKAGEIVEQGEHDDLLALNGVYKELYETQFRKIIEFETNGHSE